MRSPDPVGPRPAEPRRRRRYPAWVGRTLLECVREHERPGLPASLQAPPPGLDGHLLVDAAAWHRVSGCVRALLRQAPWMDPAALRRLDRAQNEALVRHLVGVSDLAAIGRIFAGSDIPWVTFKGPVLAGYLYPRPGLRSSVDIDVLVRPADAGRALEALEAHAYVCTERDWCRMYAEGAAETALLAPSGMVVDLHWGLISDAPTRAQFAVPSTELVDRRREILLPQVTVPTLDAVDTLVHLALHAALGGGNRLVWLNDICQAVRVDAPDWDLVVARARSWGAAAAVALMLARARRYLAAPIPDDVIDALCPSRLWPVVDATASRLSPVPRLAIEPSAARLVARAARGDGGASVRALMRKLRLGAVHRVLPATRREPVGSGDAASQRRARQLLLRSAADGA